MNMLINTIIQVRVQMFIDDSPFKSGDVLRQLIQQTKSGIIKRKCFILCME